MSGWPERGDRVVLTRGPDPVQLDVLGVHIVSDGRLGFIRGMSTEAPRHAGTFLVESTDWRLADEPELVRPYVAAPCPRPEDFRDVACDRQGGLYVYRTRCFACSTWLDDWHLLTA